MCVCAQLLICVQFCDANSATPWTVAPQAPLSTGFSRQEYWSGLPCPPPGKFLTQESNLHLISPALAGEFFTTSHHLGSPSLMTNDVNNVFACLLATHMYIFFVQTSIQFFYPFLIGLPFWFWVIKVLYIFWIPDPYQIYDLKIVTLIIWVTFSYSFFI